MSEPAAAAPASGALETCAHCHRPIASDEDAIALMREGAVVAWYHERCRPDRRTSGCAGC